MLNYLFSLLFSIPSKKESISDSESESLTVITTSSFLLHLSQLPLPFSSSYLTTFTLSVLTLF